ncbi:MAG: hypothetical protein K2X03_31545 [Bryobacteraceae bacterium]|nr:hypothetical protein [Bryobacteraceae bacterium]
MNENVQLTELIHRMQNGDRAAGESLFASAAVRLRRMSAALMASERTSGFHPSDLLQETYVQKFAGLRRQAKLTGREHFFSVMAMGMRQVLLDRGRARRAQKRQGPSLREWEQAPLPDRRLIDLATATQKLARLDPAACEVLRLKHDHGYSWDEIASRTGRSVWQVRTEYAHALHWLRAEIA